MFSIHSRDHRSDVFSLIIKQKAEPISFSTRKTRMKNCVIQNVFFQLYFLNPTKYSFLKVNSPPPSTATRSYIIFDGFTGEGHSHHKNQREYCREWLDWRNNTDTRYHSGSQKVEICSSHEL